MLKISERLIFEFITSLDKYTYPQLLDNLIRLFNFFYVNLNKK